MDSNYKVPNHACTTAENSHNEALDLFHHRFQAGGQQAQEEVFLGQSTPYLEAACEAIQVAGVQPHTTLDDIWGWPDAQVMASGVDFWDEEGFCYCLSPEKVRSLESLSSAQSVASFSFGGEEFEGKVLREITQSDEGYSILALGPSYSSLPSRLSTECTSSSTRNIVMPSPQAIIIPGTSRTPRVIDPEDPDEGEDLDLPDSDCPGLRPQDFGFLAPDHIRPRSPVPVTRAETITVTLGNWERQVTVIKPNADYRDIPSPIMQPGSPPQRPRKPSLGNFYKAPSRRDSEETHGLGILEESSVAANNNEPSFLPPSPDLKIPERAVSFTNHPSNSDVSLFNLGSPNQPLSYDEKQQQQPQHRSALDSTLQSSLPRSRGLAKLASSSLTMQPVPNLRSSYQMPTARLPARGQLRQNESIRPPVILSVQVPQGNDLSWSAPVSPESKKQTSPGVVFELDEELNDS
ncbi:hypothetical protein UA08_03958 [Talaromyces atroroseus]|uniref:Uncharacterized protein n=1 Tax=Talaromyces atroroseus TaxID=1441469 RepID=A0A1Q5Q964_TALAT|nr:hypothetical protein UA08_03958 [Talaromyces atroroseus]OKL60676.1 hypothetical protein UA08_03958 [Talaromyces atroroseus]